MTRLYEAILDRVSVKMVTIICMVILAVAALGIVAYLSWTLNVTRMHNVAGEEVVEAHITPDGTIRTVSRALITRVPGNFTLIPIRLPEPGAKLESVMVNGRNIPFAQNDKSEDKDSYIAMPSLPENALRNALLESVWSVPLKTDAKQMLVFHLQGIIPIHSYAANIVIDEGAPYQFMDRWSKDRHVQMFWTSRSDYTDGTFGTCSIGLERIG